MVKSESHSPKIRFVGFTDPWHRQYLIDMAVNNKFNNGVFNDPKKVGKGYKLINVIDMFSIPYIKESNLTLLDLSEDEFLKNQVKQGDLFFTRSSLVKEGIAWSNVYLQNNIDITYDGHLIKFSPDLSKYVPLFLHYNLRSGFIRKQLISVSKTGTMTTIGQNDIAKTIVYFPNCSEQTQIGNFFQKIDQVIELQQKALDIARNYKKSMLQKMFPQKGEKVPQIRFDGFSGDWDLKKIGDISKSFSGGTPSVDNRDFYNNGTIPFIRSGEIAKNKTELFITELALEKSSSKMVKKGDILYALYGATSGEVSRSQIDGAINQAILTIIPKDKYDSEYLVQVLALSKNLILSKFLQGGQGNLSGTIIKDLKVMFPKFEEQQKIGEFFQKLDQQIEQNEKKLESYQNLKKAMLQRMFV